MRTITCTWTYLLLMLTLGVQGQSPNRPVNSDLMPYEFNQVQQGEVGYYLFSPFTNPPTAATSAARAPKPIVLDKNGYVAWYQPATNARAINDFKFNPTHQVYTFIDFVNPTQVYYRTLDPNFQLLSTVEPANGNYYDAHEFFINRTGRQVLSTTRDSVIDLSAFTFNGNPGSANAGIRCFVIQEVDSANNLLWEWNSCDHLHPTEGYDFYGYTGTMTFDYCHGNSIEEDQDGGYILSFRHLNAVVKIERNTGNVVWRLGGKNSDFSFPNDGGFSGQHDARRLPNGNITLFDNGNMASPQATRAVEYTLDTVNGTATKVWEYQPTPAFFVEGMGSFSVADQGRALSYGITFRPNPSIETVDANANLVQRIVFSDSIQTYRTQLIEELPLPPRPLIDCEDLGGSIVLTAENGHTDYLWSTGQTSQVLMAQAGTTYQVWVPQGVGMLGSEPVEISTTGGCPPPTGTPELLPGKTPQLLRTTDLFGRPVSEFKPGNLYLRRYSDGSTKKLWITQE